MYLYASGGQQVCFSPISRNFGIWMFSLEKSHSLSWLRKQEEEDGQFMVKHCLIGQKRARIENKCITACFTTKIRMERTVFREVVAKNMIFLIIN